MHPSLVFGMFLLLISSTDSKDCTSLSDLVLSEQNRYIVYQQRGLPRSFVIPFYQQFLNDLSNFRKFPRGEAQYHGVCFTHDEIVIFFKTAHNRTAIDDEIKHLHQKFPHLPFLGWTQDVKYDPRVDRSSKMCFDRTMHSLDRDGVRNAADLPKTCRVFYDPSRRKVVNTFNKYASNAPTMSASKFLRVVAGMVIRLELKKVPRRQSIQLLRHAVAWLSSTFRALQTDGPEVRVPMLFIPFYKQACRELSELDDIDVPSVHEEVVESVLKDKLDIYTQLDVWGRLEVISWRRYGEIRIWSIAEDIFDPELLGTVAERIGYQEYDSFDHPSYDISTDGTHEWELEQNPYGSHPPDDDDNDFDYGHDDFYEPYDDSDDMMEAEGDISAYRTMQAKNSTKFTVQRSASMCETPTYEYFPMTVSTWEEACCAAICCNSLLMLSVSLTTEECCGDCNQLDCPIDNSPLEPLAMVHLEPYGWDNGCAVPVSL